jgi:hypothetical protein
MRGHNACTSVLRKTALPAALVCILSLAVVPSASAALMDTFVTSGHAQARWINDPATPPAATDTQSIELAVEARSAIDFNDAAWVTFTGFDSAPPATPPSFLYKISQTGSSGGSVRLVIRFSDGGYGFLRPLTLQAGQWSLADGAGNNWESKGGLPCGSTLSYAQMLACHPGSTVTSLEIINDSGWLYNGRFSALIDNISYGGEVLTKPAPPVLGQRVTVSRVAGNIKVRLPHKKGASEGSDLDTVDGLTQGLPVGSKIDTRRGTINLKAVRGQKGKKFQVGRFFGSVFTVTQQGKGIGRGLTSLRLKPSDRKKCSSGSSASRSSTGDPLANTARRRRRGLLRRLRGRANGRFRTRGRYSSAIVLGTIWETSDLCEGTLIRVRRGKVKVRDFRKKKTVIVKAGHSYLARAPGY